MSELQLSSLGDFLLAGWVVQPRLNRITRHGQVEKLEPRCMDLLVYLAHRPLEVHSKKRLVTEVWKVQAVAENTLNHEIAALRRAFGDDARNPKLIETIHKRGYRLLVTPGPVSEHESFLGHALGHYLLTDYLGGGGMGVVYRAEDTSLRRDVALKFLPRALSQDPSARERFIREARAASALDHPNICAIHEIDETPDGQLFIVMALYDGENLREKIDRGPLPVDEAVRIVGQIVEGLRCAHREGVIHRDIKPANVMVTTDGTVKILDFGLAKVAHTRLDPLTENAAGVLETSAGVMIGSAAYMSPEQVRCGPADRRSDLFSVGVVLYEMLSGERPFRGMTREETAAAILDRAPDPISAIPGVSIALEGLVSRCLEKNPDARYQSAADLLSDLDDPALRDDIEATPAVTEPRPRGRRPIVGIALAGLLVVVGGLVVSSMRGVEETRSGQVVQLDRMSVLVGPFVNHTGDSSLDVHGTRAASTIVDGLNRAVVFGGPKGNRLRPVLPELPTVSTANRNDALSIDGSESLVDRARSLGAATIVSGSFSGNANGYQVTGRVVDVASGQAVRVEGPVEVEPPALADAVVVVSKRLMASAMWHLSPDRNVRAMIEPPDWDTYVYYSQGIQLSAHGSEMEAHLERVLERDPDFIPALLDLAIVYSNSQRGAESRAIVEKLRSDPTRLSPFGRELLSVREAKGSGDWLTCLRHVRLMQELEPNVDMRSWLVFYLDVSNHMEELLAVSDDLLDSYDQKPPVPTFFSHKASALHMLGRYEEELEVARQYRAQFPDEILAWVIAARALSAAGRIDELRGLIDDGTLIASQEKSLALTISQDQGSIMESAVRELRVHGYREASLEFAARLVEWRRHSINHGAATSGQLAKLARAYYLAERWEDARGVYERVVADVRGKEPGNRAIARLTGYEKRLGVLAARMGDREQALRVSDALARGEHADWYGNLQYRARIAARLGEENRALDLLRQAVAEGLPVSDAVHDDPDFEPLWGDPRYQELVRPRGGR